MLSYRHRKGIQRSWYIINVKEVEWWVHKIWVCFFFPIFNKELKWVVTAISRIRVRRGDRWAPCVGEKSIAKCMRLIYERHWTETEGGCWTRVGKDESEFVIQSYIAIGACSARDFYRVSACRDSWDISWFKRPLQCRIIEITDCYTIRYAAEIAVSIWPVYCCASVSLGAGYGNNCKVYNCELSQWRIARVLVFRRICLDGLW